MWSFKSVKKYYGLSKWFQGQPELAEIQENDETEIDEEINNINLDGEEETENENNLTPEQKKEIEGLMKFDLK